jgi:hypothetical protein
MLPADLDGPPPPPDTPAYFVQVDDDGLGYAADQLQIWVLSSDWDLGVWARSNLTNLPVTAFDSNLCNYELDCIPQPAPATAEDYLDAISDRLILGGARSGDVRARRWIAPLDGQRGHGRLWKYRRRIFRIQ